MHACRFIVTNRFMHGMLHVSSMLSEGILCYGLAATILKYYACAYTHMVAIPLHKKSTASTYATSTVALLNNYII